MRLRHLFLAVIPLYILLYLSGVFTHALWGAIASTLLIFAAMCAFVDRKLGWVNYAISLVLTGFYVFLYTTDYFTPVARALGLGNKWWLYGVLYTLFIVGFGIQVLKKRISDRYQTVRTISVMFFQVVVAFIIPYTMYLLGSTEFYFSYFWPLKIEYFYPSTIFSYPLPIILYSFLGSLLVFPVLGLILGKRFYCSWVCGCGGMAETFGDRWRHLSNKSLRAWRMEQITVHAVLALAFGATVVIILNWAVGEQHPRFSSFAFVVQRHYGYVVSFVLAGAVGVGFYPTLGSRVWCRFFCPMAALLGLVQKLGRFHIRVKKDMCISCGNCSTYCEMGIDVRAYAQNNTSFTRAACVGCGMCAYVCPRGVLRLEHKKIRPSHDLSLST
jgi:polyferredoxin